MREEDLIPGEIRAWLKGQGLCAQVKLTTIDGEPPAAVQLALVRTQLTERVAESEHQRQLATLGTLSASVAHEVRNILTGIMGLSQLKVSTADLESNLQLISQEAGRCTHLLSNLLRFASRSDLPPSPVAAGELVEPVVLLTMAEVRNRRGGISTSIPSDLPIFMARAAELRQALLNLVLNALQAGGEGVEVELIARREGDQIVLEVRDTGPGVPEDMLEAVFKPFYTTNSGEGGTGLGLSISRDIVQRNGGTLTASNLQGGGACFAMRFPVGSSLAYTQMPRRRRRVGEENE